MSTTLEAAREGEPTAYPAVGTRAETQAVARGTLPVGRARTFALLSLIVASTMELLDTTIVNVELPTIESGWRASATQLQWMVSAYPLAFAVALVTGSRLGDLWGRKRVFLGGLVGFTLMSGACGFAPNAEALVGFRALQGIAAAAMIPQVLSSLQVMYAPHERAKAMGLFTGLAGLSAVLGPVIGAVLTEADLGGLGGARSSSSTCRSGCWRSWPHSGGCRNPLRHNGRASTCAGSACSPSACSPCCTHSPWAVSWAGRPGCMPRWRPA